MKEEEGLRTKCCCCRSLFGPAQSRRHVASGALVDIIKEKRHTIASQHSDNKECPNRIGQITVLSLFMADIARTKSSSRRL
jgi:hypothetical protein